MLFYLWRAQYQLFVIYHAMLIEGTGSNGELPPEKADRILVRPCCKEWQPLRNGAITSSAPIISSLPFHSARHGSTLQGFARQLVEWKRLSCARVKAWQPP